MSKKETIKAGYKAGTPVAEIARQCRSTPGSVKVMAHRMGLCHRRWKNVASVPPEMKSDYRFFTKVKGLPGDFVLRVLGVEAQGA